jgi:hypothetical protein
VADDFWRKTVALKRYRSHPMMLIGDQPQSYPSYRDIAEDAVRHHVQRALRARMTENRLKHKNSDSPGQTGCIPYARSLGPTDIFLHSLSF